MPPAQKEVNQLNPQINNFIRYFDSVLGRAERTCTEYKKELIQFDKWLLTKSKRKNRILKVKREAVVNYLVHCKERGCSNTTRARIVSILRSFYNYAEEMKLMRHHPMRNMIRPKRDFVLPKYLSKEECTKLYESVSTATDPFYRIRNRAILTIFLNCGLRLNELSTLTIGNTELARIKVHGKGGKDRIVPLNDLTREHLKDWIEIRSNRNDRVFQSKSGHPLEPASVASVVKTIINAAGLSDKGYSTHTLRHTCATLLYREGVDIRTLQTILGHASIATTEIYTHVDHDLIMTAINKNPLKSI